ncbi:hypothetical protein RF11_05897 [Thelohanellus kitauei]|uniref:Tc1-like transposase DDE domain-containing protein n=1 Tax=Thelohanellus kitauei TaxID=669202 RepID=A0A0C2N096_THEKT|nr:hypothetical protein RF11_05897 [Thelohanellus kitauei]
MSDDTIYIDETGFNLHLRRKFGRAPSRKRVSLVVTNSRGHNISVCAAMLSGGLLHFRARVGAARKKNIVMDNVRFHHTENVKRYLKDRGHTIIYLPPYSPQLNSIELLFSKWKRMLPMQSTSLPFKLTLITALGGSENPQDLCLWHSGGNPC